MGLSRLENFLKSSRGTILYVDPNSIDSTDSIENLGNSLTRPFKTLQRALVEAARFSYQRGLNNDRFNKTTIVLYPGDHLVDNRPGYIPDSSNFKRRSGETVTDLTQWTLDTNFDLSTPDNALYKLNSVHGGIIIPRGTSIVGMDLRKTKIRPTYVPNPENDQIERSSVFRVTGGCYIWQFTILDADPNGTCYKDYTTNTFVPNFSHHKLSGFEYADGVNGVYIDDDFLNGANKIDTSRTDLDMYYEKVGICYGPSSGREIQPDYNSGTIDINPVVDEYRIVGSTGASVGITSIRSGDGGVNPTTTITVDLVESIEGLSVDSPIQISGISAVGYDGQFVVSSVTSNTQFTYQTQNIPTNALPGVTGSTMSLVVDTVTSASPYIFNISLRSVYGMCGLLADGDKATGFKSMVVAQYTGIGIQKDDNAFVKYDTGTGEYKDSTTITNLHTDSRSRFKPEYENFHIKATNDAFLQLVSVFAIGYAQHFVTENGGDIALNNSNSNFGARSLVASGFKRTAFTQDDQGYITHIIPPKEIEEEEISVEFSAIDVGITTLRSAGAGTTTHLYLYNQTNENVPPRVVIDGYHIGAKENEDLNVQIFESGTINTYSSRVVMPSGPYNATQSSSEKVFTVGKDNVGINSIAANTLTLTQNHSFINGESIRIISDNGHLPDGLEPDQIYYAITRESATGIGTNQIRIAKTLSDAENGVTSASAITLNNKGGTLSIVSRVSDKNPGDIGHPVQWSGGYWYINVASTGNAIYNRINALGTAGLGNATTRAYVTRQPDSRSLVDTLYRVRYVLPKDSAGRPPIDGFILQESNDIIGDGTSEISQLYNDSGSISNTSALRNTNFIADASWTSSVATIRTELPHNLRVGDQVEIVNVTPTGYNGTYIVVSLVSAKEFTYALTSDPGTFSNNTSSRTSSLPYFRRKKYTKTYQVYRTQEIQPYISGVQDGVYYLTLLNHSNRPTVTPFRDEAFAQPVRNLYPQTNNDNSDSDPNASVSHALPGIIGEVVVDDPQKSITKETLESFVVGTGITNIISSSGTAHTIYTSVDHGFSGITTVSVVSGGANYGSTGSFSGDLYNARLVGFAGSTTGANATAKITVSSGAITAVKIIDGGSAYGIGNTLTVVGVATTTSFVAGVVRVDSISNNVEDAIKVAGITSASNAGYNNLYRISGITTGRTKEINVVSSETISGFSTTGLGVTVTANAGYIPTGKVLQISSLTYTSSSGIATVGFTTSHGFQVDNKIRIDGANESAFNGDFIVKSLNSLTSLTINVGVSVTISTSATGTLYTYRPVLTSYAGDLLKDTENISGRLNYEYAGITTVLGAQYTTGSTGDLTIPNAVSLGLNLGDYLLINNEIFRIDTAVTSNTVSVLRAVLGSPRQTHVTGTVVRKIHVRPVELRRNSIIRASGHTFEYLGFGPGNYSTSLPEKQDRVLTSAEKLLAQSIKTDGGIVVYTGMDSEGAFYAGNRKVNSATGQEESYDTPIPTFTGEKEVDNLVNITETQKLFAESSIKVEGGRDKSIVSEFDGPVVFNNKVSVNSDIEMNSIFIQGDEEVSRQFSIINTTPTSSGNYGDILFNSEPSKYEFIGWTYVTENNWEPFGWIGGPGVGIASAGTYVGFSTLLNLVATGFTFGVTYDANSGISTLTWDADPRIGIYTGANATNFLGRVTNLNFVGGAVTVSGGTDVGIATITISLPTGIGGSTPGLPYYSLQWNNNDSFAGQSIGYYDPNLQEIRFGSAPGSSDENATFFTNTGRLGFSTSQPSAKIEIVADNETSLYIKSTSGGNIVRVDNTTNDTTPFIIDGAGNVGINVDTTLAALDVVGNAAVTGEVRIYETDRSNYVGLGVTTLSSDLNFKLPVSYGTDGQVLVTNGSGTLSWSTFTGGDITSAGAGITITRVGQTATITNSGVRRIIAGTGVTINPTSGTGEVTISASGGTPNLYPFTTRGFSIPI
jgi:hypothetical protein